MFAESLIKEAGELHGFRVVRVQKTEPGLEAEWTPNHRHTPHYSVWQTTIHPCPDGHAVCLDTDSAGKRWRSCFTRQRRQSMKRWPMAWPIVIFRALPILASMRAPTSEATPNSTVERLNHKAYGLRIARSHTRNLHQPFMFFQYSSRETSRTAPRAAEVVMAA